MMDLVSVLSYFSKAVLSCVNGAVIPSLRTLPPNWDTVRLNVWDFRPVCECVQRELLSFRPAGA